MKSKFYQFIPCTGTLKKDSVTRQLVVVNPINYTKREIKRLRRQLGNSSKLAKCNHGNPKYFRKNLFNSENMTLFEVMNLPLRRFLSSDEYISDKKPVEGLNPISRYELSLRKQQFLALYKRTV